MDRCKLMLYVLMYCKYCHLYTCVMDRLTHIETNIVLNDTNTMCNNPSGSCDSDFLVLAGVTDPNFICILNYLW